MLQLEGYRFHSYQLSFVFDPDEFISLILERELKSLNVMVTKVFVSKTEVC